VLSLVVAVRVIDEEEFRKIIWRIDELREFVRTIDELTRGAEEKFREAVTDYVLGLGRVSTVLGEATIDAGDDFSFYLKIGDRSLSYEKIPSGLLFFELTRLTEFPMTPSAGFDMRWVTVCKGMRLHWLQEDGYLSAFKFRKGKSRLSFLKGNLTVLTLDDDVGYPYFASEVLIFREWGRTWFVQLLMYEDVEHVGLLKEAHDATSGTTGERREVARRIAGSILAQVDAILTSSAYGQAKENVLGFLAML